MHPRAPAGQLSRTNIGRLLAALPCVATLARVADAAAQSLAKADAEPPGGPPGMVSLTLFLRHDDRVPVDKFDQHLKNTDWYARFPPPGAEVLSWHVMMGFGQVVTLRVPHENLQDINRMVATQGCGAFRMELYPTYAEWLRHARPQARSR
jgi:hypothetical protein